MPWCATACPSVRPVFRLATSASSGLSVRRLRFVCSCIVASASSALVSLWSSGVLVLSVGYRLFWLDWLFGLFEVFVFVSVWFSGFTFVLVWVLVWEFCFCLGRLSV